MKSPEKKLKKNVFVQVLYRNVNMYRNLGLYWLLKLW